MYRICFNYVFKYLLNNLVIRIHFFRNIFYCTRPKRGCLGWINGFPTRGSLKKFRKISVCEILIAIITKVCIIDHHNTRSFNSSANLRP